MTNEWYFGYVTQYINFTCLPSLWVCVRAWMRVCVICMCVCWCSHPCGRTWRPEAGMGMFPSIISPSYFLRWSFSWNLEAPDWLLSPQDPAVSDPSTEIRGTWWHMQLFCVLHGCWKAELRSPCLHFNHWSISPAFLFLLSKCGS